MVEYCVCGCIRNKHTWLRTGLFQSEEGCSECLIKEPYDREKTYHKFKLDNLKLIEDLAKERKLI